MKSILSRPMIVYVAQSMVLLLILAWGFLLYQNLVYRLIPEATIGSDPSGGSTLLALLPVILLVFYLTVGIVALAGLMAKKSFGRWVTVGLLLVITLTIGWRAVRNTVGGPSDNSSPVDFYIALAFDFLLTAGVGFVGIAMAVSKSVGELFAAGDKLDKDLSREP